ncbi:hypothetical protein BO78DRAFT_320372, partial [Aspergillus sclerotiicarbonarius CBS 121057]
HTTTGCGEQGFPSAQPYLSHTPGANPFCCMFLFLYIGYIFYFMCLHTTQYALRSTPIQISHCAKLLVSVFPVVPIDAWQRIDMSDHEFYLVDIAPRKQIRHLPANVSTSSSQAY